MAEEGDIAVMTFEMLKRMQGQLGRVADDVHDIKVRMTNVEIGMGQLQTQMGQLNARMDRMDDRILRIERRLDIVEAPQPAAE